MTLPADAAVFLVIEVLRDPDTRDPYDPASLPCHLNPDGWDDDAPKHIRLLARRECLRCPALDACGTRAAELGPQARGVWGGQLGRDGVGPFPGLAATTQAQRAALYMYRHDADLFEQDTADATDHDPLVVEWAEQTNTFLPDPTARKARPA